MISRFGPPLAWMGVIAFFSGPLFGGERTETIVLPLLARLLPWAAPDTLQALHLVLRKLGHIIDYGILAVLWRRALVPGRSPRQAAAWAFALAALYGVLDEARQGLAPNRQPSPVDAIIDAAGAGLALVCLTGSGRPERLALRGGTVVAAGLALASLAWAAIDLTLGLPAWDLAAAAAGLALLAGALRRFARGHPPGGALRGGPATSYPDLAAPSKETPWTRR